MTQISEPRNWNIRRVSEKSKSPMKLQLRA
jgi:hypothetical protein